MKKLILLIIPFLFFQCKTYFYCLPDNTIEAEKINGTYENQSILSPFGNKDLWQCFDRKSRITNDSLYVSLIVYEKSIQAQLIGNNKIIDTKIIKGELTDSCFYAKKKYRIVPILPILWWYDNEKIRISARDSSLIIDYFSETGGAAIIMAGGDDWRNTFEFKKLKY